MVDSCRRAYFDEKQKTGALSERLSRLRAQLDSLQLGALRAVSVSATAAATAPAGGAPSAAAAAHPAQVSVCTVPTSIYCTVLYTHPYIVISKRHGDFLFLQSRALLRLITYSSNAPIQSPIEMDYNL